MGFLALLIVLKELGLSSDSLFFCDEPSGGWDGGLFQNYPCLPPHVPLKSSLPASGSSAVSDVSRNAAAGGFFKMENVVSGKKND